MIAGTTEDLQNDAAKISLVDCLASLTDPGVEQLINLGLSSADSTFGFPELHHPCFLLAIRVRSYIDNGLCMADEELAMVTLVQCDHVSNDLDERAQSWLGDTTERLSEARLQVLQHSVLPLEGAKADELRAALAPSSVLATMFGAFLTQEFAEAVDYTERMLSLAEQLQRHQGNRTKRLLNIAPDLRSRLIFLNAIVGNLCRAEELADQVLSRAGDRLSWLDVYNSALLSGYREEWAIGAEVLADLQPKIGTGVANIFLLLHLVGLPLDGSRPPAARFARLSADQLDDVLAAQRMSFEAMSGRHSRSDYLAHVHSLVVPAATRVGAWTLAKRYGDAGLAATLIGQLLESDPGNRETYEADIDFLRNSGSETRAGR